MDLTDLIKMLPLVPQFQGIWQEIRQLKTRVSQAEAGTQSVEGQVIELEAKIQANNEFDERVRKLEYQLQDLNRRIPK